MRTTLALAMCFQGWTERMASSLVSLNPAEVSFALREVLDTHTLNAPEHEKVAVAARLRFVDPRVIAAEYR